MQKKLKRWQILSFWAPKSLWTVTAAMKLKDTCSLEKKLWQTYTVNWKAETSLYWQRSIIVKAIVFPVVMYRCESWTIKKAGHQRMNTFKLWCWRRQGSLGQQGDQTVSPKGNHPWIFTGRTDAEADTPILWPPDVRSRLIRKDPDPGNDWRQKEKRVAEVEMVR